MPGFAEGKLGSPRAGRVKFHAFRIRDAMCGLVVGIAVLIVGPDFSNTIQAVVVAVAIIVRVLAARWQFVIGRAT